MAALGMIVQRADVVTDFIEGDGAVALSDDRFEIDPAEGARLDVLANDVGLGADAVPVIATAPGCGDARVVGNQIAYDGSGCSGEQRFIYRVDGAGVATVRLAIVGRDAPVSRDAPDGIAAARDRDAGPDLAGSGLERPDPGTAAEPAFRPTQPSRPVVAPFASDRSGVAVAQSSGEAVRAPLRGPDTLDTTARSPDAVTAPETVGAPRIGAAPESIATDETTAPAATETELAVAAPAPAGLFGASDRVATQTAPDPSRPAPAVPLGNLLAFTPRPMPGPERAGDPLPGAADRSIANMPPSFAEAPAAMQSPLTLADRDRPAATLSLARVDRSISRRPEPAALGAADGAGQLDAEIPRANPVRIVADQSARLALRDPSIGLGDARALGLAGSLVPVEAALPSGLSAPSARDRSLLAALGDGAAAVPDAGGGSGAADQETETALVPVPRPRPVRRESREAEDTEIAALPTASGACATPPAMTVDPQPAGRTGLVIVSPCHAGSIAELRYSGLRLAIPLDAAGEAELDVLGFETRSPAVLWFRDGQEIAFDLPFVGMRRLTRVGLVWDSPVVLDLHAFEFGAEVYGDGHVFPGNRRSFDTIRRSGGGFLTTYAAISGIGQNMQIYSFWRRPGGDGGVIDLAVDYASRSRDALPETCGDGRFAAPAFVVLRSVDGERERPLNRRLSALSCGGTAEGSLRLIEAAIDDVIITGR